MSINRREFSIGSLALGAALATASRLAAATDTDPIARAIPSTGEMIPIMGVGTNRYGVGDDKSLRAPLQDALSRFHELGGTVIDTAPGYRTSETVLGQLIDKMGLRDDLFVATKVDREDRDDSNQRMEESFRKLRIEQADLMQIHNLRGWRESIPLMKDWQAEGRIRYVGITTSRESQYEELEMIMRAHELEFVQTCL